MVGVIKLKDVLLNPRIIVSEFGWRVLYTCIIVSLRGEATTFLDILNRS